MSECAGCGRVDRAAMRSKGKMHPVENQIMEMNR